MKLRRTVLNWRWWVVLPVFLVLLPLALISWLAEALSDPIARVTTSLIRWTHTTPQPRTP